MNNDKILSILKKCANVLQGNYQTQSECKKHIEKLLEELNEFHVELTGKTLIERIHLSEKRVDYTKK